MSAGRYVTGPQEAPRMPADVSTAVQPSTATQCTGGAVDSILLTATTSTTIRPVSESIQFLQLNLQHCQSASALLVKQIAKLDTVIAVIQEPWVNQGRILGLNSRGCNIYHGFCDSSPRACIVTKGVRTMCLPQFSDRDITTISVSFTVHNRDRTLIVSSVYMAIEDQPPPLRMEQLVQHCMANNLPLIIASDTNSHHPFWGSGACNHRGLILSEYIATTNLEVVNSGSEPTFCSGNKRTVIDVTFANSILYKDIHGWQVSTTDTMSDHRQIQFVIKRDRSAPSKRRNVRRTDWDVYGDELYARIGMWFGTVDTSEDIERELDVVNTAILNSFYKACPERRISGRNKMPWWNHDLKVLRQQANRAFHRAYKSGLEQDWQSHRKARRSFKKELRRCKRESWQNFCSRVEGVHESSRIGKILGRSTVGNLGMLRKPDGQWTTTSLEVYQHLLETHFPGSKTESGPSRITSNICHLTPRWQSTQNLRALEEIITVDRIRWAISTMSPFKSPGKDGIFPILLQKGIQYLVYPLQSIYRASLLLGYIPNAWRVAQVAFIPKPGKLDYTTAKAFRPISLTSFLLKGMEKLVDRYLRSGPLTTLPIHPRQHAFQTGKSTESALHQLVGRIERALDANEYSLGVFFDIEGAFDNTPVKAVDDALAGWKVPRILRSWIIAMLTHRVVEVNACITVITVITLCGLPQGGGLSPILWSLVADSLLSWLSKQGVYVQGYADDGCILVCGKVLTTMSEIMQRILRGVEDWCRKRDLRVNPSKTEIILFTRKYKPDTLRAITFYGQQLLLTKQVKYLGVILDSKLNWKEHVDAKCKKALASFYQLRRVAGKTWGTSPKVTHWIYTVVLRPMLCYAAVIWWARTQLITVKKQLEHLQRLACLYITGAKRTAPTAALEIITGIAPLTVHIKREAMAACFRLKLNSQWVQTTGGHTKINQVLATNVPLSRQRVDYITPRYVFDKNYTTFVPDREDWKFNRVTLKDDVVCFTDGSRYEQSGLAGAGVYDQTDGEELVLPLGHHTSVFQAEVYALLTCARLLILRNGCSIAICSDSLAAIKAVSAHKATTGLVVDAMTALQALATFNIVRLIWVPGHCGITGNEKADLLAKQASSSCYIGPEPSVGISVSTIYSSISSWAVHEQNKLWQELSGCRQAKRFLYGCDHSRARYALNLSRQDLRILVGILTGHADLNRHLHIMGLRQDSGCPLCQEDEDTSLHFIANCSALMLLRKNILGDFTLSLDSLRNIHWFLLLKFAKASKRFYRP